MFMLIDFRNNLTAEEETRLASNLLIDLPDGDLSQPLVLKAWKKRAWVGVAYSLSLSAHKILQKLKRKSSLLEFQTVWKYGARKAGVSFVWARKILLSKSLKKFLGRWSIPVKKRNEKGAEKE